MISEMTEHNYFDGGVPTQTFRQNAIKPNGNGSFRVEGVRIFRTGQFRDSKGKKHNITTDDLNAMVDNWGKLRGNNIFPDVPVRKDHSTSVEKVMGYFANLYTEQEGDVHFLTADFDSMTEEDVNKLAMGLYRNVSAEVGVYPANNDEMYYPTVMGVAYVDIPAVEGLFRKPSAEFSWTSNGLEISENAGESLTEWVASRPEITYYSRVDQQENTVTTENDKNFTFRIGSSETQDFGKVQAYIGQIEGENETLKAENEQYAKDRVDAEKAERANFVKGLSEGDAPKITAAQVEGLQKVAESMDADTFAAFKASYEAAPSLRQFQEHGNGTNHDGKNGTKSEKDEAIAIYRQRVDTLRRSGMPAEKIEKTESFRKLTELEKASA